MKFKKFLYLVFCVVLFSQKIIAHPMPHTVVLLDVKQDHINVDLKIPLKELQFAIDFDVTNHTDLLLKKHYRDLEVYLLDHIHPKTTSGLDWKVEVLKMNIDSAEQEATGVYNELTVQLLFIPPTGTSVRKFNFYYDAILHQLVTHKVLVSVRQDFDSGKIDENEMEVGVIYVRPSDNSIAPLQINLEDGTKWEGFKSMVQLGINHISEGTDHLLFIIVLLLASPLIVENKKWMKSGTVHSSIKRLIKIITAFTIGHSLTLCFAAFQIISLPAQPVEVLITITIIITAIHSVIPIFPKREMLVALFFGFIHGLAFANTLQNLQLDTTRMLLSVFGFNIGIELMQLFVILLVFPWLLIMSDSAVYRYVRYVGATLASIVASAWMLERITQKQNALSEIVQQISINGKYLILVLAVIALMNAAYCKFLKKDDAQL